MTDGTKSTLAECIGQRITEYLSAGGMFNPELANHDAVRDLLIEARDELMRAEPLLAVPLLLWCPQCNARHIDQGEFATKLHHTHACQDCGMVWRPAIVATVGVQYLPGFKDRGVIV